MKMKLNYNNMLRHIDDVLGAEEIETVHEEAFGIATGLELLSNMLRNLAEHAIETNDEFLIEWCKNLLIIKEEKEE